MQITIRSNANQIGKIHMQGSLSDTEPVEIMNTALAPLPLYLPDASSAVRDALARALEFAASQTAAPDSTAVLEALRRRDATMVRYTTYGLATRLAETLGALDETVNAVYLFDTGVAYEDESCSEPARDFTLHLIVRVERKTKALSALISGLDRALTQAVAALYATPTCAHLLDAQIVDAAEVQQRIGYGAFLSSLHQRPLQVWQR